VRNRMVGDGCSGCGLVLACWLRAGAQSKDSFTPMALDSGFGPWILPPPAIPPEQIIKQFAAKESEFQQALNHYTYRRTPRCRPSTTTTRWMASITKWTT
jgi:hypothetical protein